MTTALILAFLAILLVGGYLAWRGITEREAEIFDLKADLAAVEWWRSKADDQADRLRTMLASAESDLRDMSDLCTAERERAQIAEAELYGLLIDHHGVTPIAAARAVRRA